MIQLRFLGLTEAEAGENFITLLPGFQLWDPESNWQIRMGIGLPISSDRENDVASHLQVGNHRVYSDDYIDRMKTGFQHWVDGGKAGHLAWGILHFQTT